MNIHEEFDRLILRRRWVAWADREWRWCGRGKADRNRMQRRLLMLAGRLACWKPTFQQRMHMQRACDGAVP